MEKIKNHNKSFVFNNQDQSDASVIQEIFSYREYRAAEELIVKAKTILDVGAHIGIFSAYASALNPQARIYALEPEKNNFLRLKKTIKDNQLKNVKIINQALAKTSGERTLYLSPDSINHSLLPEGNTTQVVSATSLEDLISTTKIKQIDLVKLDIEGGEYELLDTWGEKEYRFISAIILEYHQVPDRDFKELEQKLRENGFSVQIFPSRFDSDLGFILARQKKYASTT